jgi:hypothetical protein
VSIDATITTANAARVIGCSRSQVHVLARKLGWVVFAPGRPKPSRFSRDAVLTYAAAHPNDRQQPLDPETVEEWQAAVDAAYGAICLDSVRQYALVTGGPQVDVDRCQEILAGGRVRGIFPTEGADIAFIQAFLEGNDDENNILRS